MHNVMLRMFACTIGATASLALSAGAQAACIPTVASANTALRATVRSINSSGLDDFARANLGKGNMMGMSPLARAYTREILASGSAPPPSGAQQAGAHSVIRALLARRGLELSSGIWIDRSGAAFGRNDEQRLAQSTCTEVNYLFRDPQKRDAPVDTIMTAWITRSAAVAHASVPDPAGFVELLHHLTWLGPSDEHPLNLLTSLFVRGSFDLNPRTSWPKPAEIPYYSEDGVQGVRLDSVANGVAVYVFSGQNDAIENLHRELKNDAQWATVRGKFVSRELLIQPVAFVNDFRDTFDPGVRKSYGTFVATTYDEHALEQTSMTIDSAGFTLAALTGDEGVPEEQALGLVHHWKPLPAAWSSQGPMILIVEDRPTGALLFVGGHLTPTP